MYEDKTNIAILDNMLDNAPDNLDKREGSVTHDLLSPAAIEFELAYVGLGAVLALGFADSSEGNYLERKTSELISPRKPSVKAIGEITITGDVNLFIVKGTRLITGAGVYFVTTQDATIGVSGTVTVAIVAEEGGVFGNVGIGEIESAEGDLADVIEVTNEEQTDGGVNVESDESLLSRYLARVRKPVTSGNPYHYEQWAKEVAGVGDAKVYPLWDGAGTVKVVLLDEEKTTPAQTVIDATVTHIEKQRPIGADVTVVGAQEIAINVSADLVLTSNVTISDVKADIERGVTEYLASLAFTDTLIRYTRIAAILLDIPRIIDYANLTVNGTSENIEITDEQVAVLGEVNVVDA